MTRQEFLIALIELNTKQVEFAKRIKRHPVTVARWGISYPIPQFAVEFIEMMRWEAKARVLAFALDKHKLCKNGHELNEYIGIKNGDLICSYCQEVVEPNIYKGES